MKLFIKLLLFSIFFVNTLHANTDITLQLFWKHQFEFAGYYAAKEKGFYKEVGLEVDFKEYEPGLNVSKEVTSGKADFGTASSSALLNYLSGEPVVLLANIFKHSALVILADKKAGIRTPQDLQGKRLMLTEHEKSAVEFKSFFSKNHIDTSKLTFIEHNFDPFSINDGRVDAMSAYITNQPYILRKNKIEFSILDPVNYGGDFYGDSLFTSSQMLQKDPEAVRAFTKASIKGWQYAINNTDEIIDLILSKYNTQNKSREALKYEAQETKKLILADVYKIGSIDKDKIQRIVDVMQATKTVDKKTVANNLNIDKFILDMDLPTVNVIRFFDEPPFTLNSKDKNEGYSYELLEYLLKSVNLKPNYINGYGSYKAMLEAIESGEADILTTISTNLKLPASSNISKTKAILKTPFVLVAKSSDRKISSIKGAFGKKVAVVKGYVQDQYLSNFPQVTKVYVNNNDEGFEALRLGKADYYLNNRANTEYILQKSFETDLKIVAQLSTKNFPLFSISLGISKKNKELVSLLNNALQDIPYNEIKKLKDKWLVYSDERSKNTIALSKEERIWIDKHPLINVGVEMDWAPYDYVDENGNYAGIAKEYLNIISEKTGIEFEYKSGQTWSQLLESIKQKKIDMLPSLYFSKERSQFIEFSDSYMSTVNYLYVKDDNKEIKSVKDINNKKIAMVKGGLVIKDIKKLYKNVDYSRSR